MSVIKPPAARADSAFVDTLFAAEVADQGFVSTHTSVLSLNAEAYEAWEELTAAVHRSMGTRRYELVTLAAAKAIGSTHCRLAHGRKSLAVFSREQLLRIARDYRTAGLDEAEVAMMEFAERLSTNASSMTDADGERLRDLGLSDREIVDVVLAAAARNFYSRAVQSLAIELDPVELDEELRDALLAGLAPDRATGSRSSERTATPCAGSTRCRPGGSPRRSTRPSSTPAWPAACPSSPRIRRRSSTSSPPCASPG